MFLRIEGDHLVNLMQVARVELRNGGPGRQTAHLYGASGLMFESAIAYRYFSNAANAEFLFVADRAPQEPPAETAAEEGVQT